MAIKDMRKMRPKVAKHLAEQRKLSEVKKAEIEARRSARAQARQAKKRGAAPKKMPVVQPPKPTPKVLYAGPWNGEFGWELCSWNPVVRHRAKDFERVIVETVPGSEYLYEFADEIIVNPRAGDFDMYSGRSKNPIPKPEKDWLVLAPAHHWKRGGGHAEFRAIKKATRDSRSIPKKEWRILGTENPHFVADIMCAFRGPKTFKGRKFPEKQYPEAKCDALVQMFRDAGYSVACYGGEDNYYVEGTIDYRGKPLEELCGALSMAKCAVGPSSGTIHLASLCRLPQVTWYGRPIVSLDRYMFYWNPFETPCTFIDVPCPDAGIAFEATLERLDSNTPLLHNRKK